MSWPTSKQTVRLAPWNRFKPSSKLYFYWPFQGGASFVHHLCYLCHVLFMRSRLFIAFLWSPAGKGLIYWLLFVMLIVFLSLSHVVSWVKCGTWLYQFLIFATFLTFTYSDKCSICPYKTNDVAAFRPILKTHESLPKPLVMWLMWFLSRIHYPHLHTLHFHFFGVILCSLNTILRTYLASLQRAIGTVWRQ